MELSKQNQLVEVRVLSSPFADLLKSQKDLFQSQIEDLQQAVATQCRLTGVNPLSQEMAAGALSVKIGKRPRDLMNPKAVKYMQFVFSIKDAISKRETREISAHFGVTVTQVRDFFTGQRSRVRRFIRLCREKAEKSVANDTMHNGLGSSSDPNMPTDAVPLNVMAPSNVEEPSCSLQNEVIPGIEESEKDFVENIFELMRKEESFWGQVKLLEWILCVNNRSVLNWFLHEGGVMILATWLIQAATEEQTSVLNILIKVLHHLPLHQDLPVHVSAILQSVNRLRFYRTPDISSRARALLAKWSNRFASRPPMKSKSSGDAQAEMLLKQSIEEVMGNESWDLKEDQPEEAQRVLCDDPGNNRKSEAAQPLKMIMASGDDSSKRRGVLSAHMRERRKVQMVEQPGQRLAVKSPQAAKSAPAIQSRPLSADDIQKAKMRLQFMQGKHGKTVTHADDSVKPESQNRGSLSQDRISQSVPKSYVRPESEENRKFDPAFVKVDNPPDASLNLEEPPWKKCKRIQIPWQTPPEVKISEAWRVGVGDNSKEVEVQENRIRRERETIYRSVQEIPPNPRQPWDLEMEYDDSLTPEIPIEQLPDVEPLETPMVSDDGVKGNVASGSSTSAGSVPAPDLELLAELLKNPALVFALTSGKVGDLSSQDTVKLLDMIKTNGVSALGSLGGNVENKVEVSLPSPTPSIDPVPNGYRPDPSKNPFSRQHTAANGNAYQGSGVAGSTLVHPQTSTMVQQRATAMVPPVQTSIQSAEQWQAPTNLPMGHQMNRLNNTIHHLNPETMLNKNVVSNSNLPLPNGMTAASPVVRAEPLGNPNPSVPLVMQRQFPYVQEPPSVSNSYRTREVVERIHPYQNNPNADNYNGYGGRPMQAALPPGTWGGRMSLAERPEFESWSPDNSPSRQREYGHGPSYHEQRASTRRGRGPDNVVQPSGYRERYMGGASNKRWRDNGRWN